MRKILIFVVIGVLLVNSVSKSLSGNPCGCSLCGCSVIRSINENLNIILSGQAVQDWVGTAGKNRVVGYFGNPNIFFHSGRILLRIKIKWHDIVSTHGKYQDFFIGKFRML